MTKINQTLTGVQLRWVEALESGRYKQGDGWLRTGSDCYCCLGVACDLFPRSPDDGWILNASRNTYAFGNRGDSYSSCLGEKVREWLGMWGSLGTIQGEFVTDFYHQMQKAGFQGPTSHHTLADYNDGGATFAQIAAAIRACPQAVFFIQQEEEAIV